MEQSINNLCIMWKSVFFFRPPFLSLSHGGAEWNEIFMFGSELEALINVDYNP